jgi:hypothetical protein
MRQDEYAERWAWEDAIERLGFTVKVELLWDAMIGAREQSSFGLPVPQLADDPEKLKVFSQTVRSLYGSSLSDQFIVESLLAMPRTCVYCQHDCAEWCDGCGGCSTCCDSEIHCLFCHRPEYICGCPDCRCRQGFSNN